MNRRSLLAAGSSLLFGTALAQTGLCADQPAALPSDQVDRPNAILIFTDDQGYADLGCQQQRQDIATPNLDRLAAEGVRFTNGYIAAPQCAPSRAALMTGCYQQRFGLDHIPDCPLPLEEITVADRLKAVGYKTGFVGKWHLEPNLVSEEWAAAHFENLPRNPQGHLAIPGQYITPYFPDRRGFTDVFFGEMRRYFISYRLDGTSTPPGGEWIDNADYRLDVQTDAALSFLDRHQQEPFFLYLAYFAPHTPLEATEKYLERFPEDMPTRRRYALAMLSAVDDGVGRIMNRLDELGLDENTVIFFTSDNGAPRDHTCPDHPIDIAPGSWDGSLNDPWVGEKGMLTEGGIRVPFLARWKGTIPAGQVCDDPVISIDMTTTIAALAEADAYADFDGIDLMPHLTAEAKPFPERDLYWRFWNQSAVRRGNWKYLQVGSAARYLFDLSSPEHENRNLIDQHPELVAELQQSLAGWAAELHRPGVPDGEINPQEKGWYQHYLGLEIPSN